MINIPLTKLLFLDIETVGIQPEWESFYTIYSAAKLVLLPGEGDKQTKLRLLEHHKALEMGKT